MEERAFKKNAGPKPCCLAVVDSTFVVGIMAVRAGRGE